MVYGAALTVPGISATIFAVILGYYDELVNAVNGFNKNRRGNAKYLTIFIFGAAVGSVIFSTVIMFLLDSISLIFMLFIIGLMMGVLPHIAFKLKDPSARIAPKELILAMFSFVILFAFSRIVAAVEINAAGLTDNVSVFLILYVAFAGVINGATLLVPGFSGALILLCMGLYPLIISAVSSVGRYFADMGNLTLLWEIIVVLLPFGVGALIGCLCMAKIVGKLMRDHNKSLYAVILGLIMGSAAALLFDPIIYQSGVSVFSVSAGAVMFLAGCAVSFSLGRKKKA
jgi:putative membrane protein